MMSRYVEICRDMSRYDLLFMNAENNNILEV